jgi:hypothetical protein
MNAVDPKIAWGPVGIRLTSDPNLNLGGTRLLKDLPDLDIGRLLTKVVQMAVGNRRETLISVISKDVIHPLTKLFGRRA